MRSIGSGTERKPKQAIDLHMITGTHELRRPAPGRRRTDKFLTLVAMALAAGPSFGNGNAADTETPERIAAAARDAVIRARQLDTERALVEAQAPDARLRLARCDRRRAAARAGRRCGWPAKARRGGRSMCR